MAGEDKREGGRPKGEAERERDALRGFFTSSPQHSHMADVLNLHPAVRRAAQALLSSVRRAGYTAEITSAYRDPNKQASLYRDWLAGRRRLPVAPPGLSTHQYGFAIDVVSSAPIEVLVDLAQAIGFRWAGPRDPVHFDPFGLELWRRLLRSAGF